MEFKVLAPGGNELEIIDRIPSFTQNLLSFDTEIEAKAEFGSMNFKNYKGDGFEIWHSNYNIKHNTELIGRADLCVLELHIQFKNHFEIEWDGFGKNKVRQFQFNLSHTPYVNNWAKFIPGAEYQTFDIHFTKEYLERLAPDYYRLGKLLERVEQALPAQYGAVDHFLTSPMIAIINEIIECKYASHTARFHVESKVMELLLHALQHASGNVIKELIHLSKPDIESLHEAREILLKDFENKITIVQLARKVCINDCKLKRGFKQLFGATIFDFQQTAKMEKARALILDTDHAVDDICTMVGYSHVTNFNIAFTKHFGHTPGYLRKK